MNTTVDRLRIAALAQSEGWGALKRWLQVEREDAIREVLKAARGQGGDLSKAAYVEMIDKLIRHVEGIAKEVQNHASQEGKVS